MRKELARTSKNEVSLQEIKIWKVLKTSTSWTTNDDIAAAIPDVSPRTVRLHTKRLAAMGLVEEMRLFPAHAYRWLAEAENKNREYVQKLESAAAVFAECR